MRIKGLRYRVLIILSWVLPLVVSAAKTKLPKTVVQRWQITSPTGIADSIYGMDTSFINFPMRDVLYDHSIQNEYNGNLVGPVQSAIYFQRLKKTDCLFATPYDVYTITPQDVLFYNTTTPVSTFSYKRGFTTYHEDYDVHLDFTANINRRTNLGAQLNLLSGVGHYKNQAGKTWNGSVWGSFNGNHYSLQAAFTFNSLRNFENGGLLSIDDLRNKDMNTDEMPVQTEGMSGLRYLAGYINHYYSLTTTRDETVHYREKDERGRWQDLDSIRTMYIPVITFRHVFETNEVTRRYIEQKVQPYYPDVYRNHNATNDSAAVLTIKNTFSVTFEEAFNKKLRFGGTVFVLNESQRHLLGAGWGEDDLLFPAFGNDLTTLQQTTLNAMSDEHFNYYWSNNLFVGGALYKRNGKKLKYNAEGNVCVVGRKIGEFHIKGDLATAFYVGQDSMLLKGYVNVYNETPDYYLTHYYSNHYQWDVDTLRKTYHIHGGIQWRYPSKWFTLGMKVDYENINNYTYFESSFPDSVTCVTSSPRQMRKTLHIFSADLTANLTTPWVNLDNHVIYQYSSNNALSLPMISLYSNLYYHGTWFKALDAQIGVDLSYHTLYYASYANGALGQFTNQRRQEIGNYPILSVYANFYVRLLHINFFAQYEHLNASFMGRQYFGMASYPLNPDVFRAGISFRFYK